MSPTRPCLRCGRLLGSGSYCRAHRPDKRSPDKRSPGRGSGGRAATFRRKVLAKTGGRCAVCGVKEGVEAHHVVSLSRGGSNDPANGVPLCREHHKEAGAAGAKACFFGL